MSNQRARNTDRVFRGNIFLVGLMGAGKTSVGKLLARRLGKTFYDSDHEIERSTNVPIADRPEPIYDRPLNKSEIT